MAPDDEKNFDRVLGVRRSSGSLKGREGKGEKHCIFLGGGILVSGVNLISTCLAGVFVGLLVVLLVNYHLDNGWRLNHSIFNMSLGFQLGVFM